MQVFQPDHHWVRDYCFTPLNMWIARNGSPRWRFTLTVGAYVFTMMLIALWHGVTWGFVLFGLTHAAQVEKGIGISAALAQHLAQGFIVENHVGRYVVFYCEALAAFA